MSTRWKLKARGLLVACVLAGLVLGACGGGSTPASLGRNFVLKPDLVHYGASYSEWSARWWQWTYEIPADIHPLFDQVGTDAGVGQVDPVWFLGGVFGVLEEPLHAFAERTVTVPHGVALFFPIINVGGDNVICLPDTWGPDKSPTELYAYNYDIVSSVTDLYCYVDGDVVLESPDLADAVEYRAIAAEFSAWMPANHLGVRLCDDPPGPVLVSPMVSDGIWMMLAPMPPGEHTLEFGGIFPLYGPFVIDIIYHITVLPAP